MEQINNYCTKENMMIAGGAILGLGALTALVIAVKKYYPTVSKGIESSAASSSLTHAIQPQASKSLSGIFQQGTGVVPVNLQGVQPAASTLQTSVQSVTNECVVLENGITLKFNKSPMNVYTVGQQVSLQPVGRNYLLLPIDESKEMPSILAKVVAVQPSKANMVAQIRFDRSGAIIKLRDGTILHVDGVKPFQRLPFRRGDRLVITSGPDGSITIRNFDQRMRGFSADLLEGEAGKLTWQKGMNRMRAIRRCIRHWWAAHHPRCPNVRGWWKANHPRLQAWWKTHHPHCPRLRAWWKAHHRRFHVHN